MLIKTAKYDALTPVQQKAASSVGHTRRNVEYLKKRGISETRIWLPNPNYVAEALDACDDPFWRASWLGSFNYSSNFKAYGRDIDNYGRVRGVCLVAPQGALENLVVPSAPQEITPARCYETLLANPAVAVRALDDKTAAGLSGIITQYLAGKAQ